MESCENLLNAWLNISSKEVAQFYESITKSYIQEESYLLKDCSLIYEIPVLHVGGQRLAFKHLTIKIGEFFEKYLNYPPYGIQVSWSPIISVEEFRSKFWKKPERRFNIIKDFLLS